MRCPKLGGIRRGAVTENVQTLTYQVRHVRKPSVYIELRQKGPQTTVKTWASSGRAHGVIRYQDIIRGPEHNSATFHPFEPIEKLPQIPSGGITQRGKVQMFELSLYGSPLRPLMRSVITQGSQRPLIFRGNFPRSLTETPQVSFVEVW